MKERFDYNDLKEMAETFARDNKSMALRIEVIKEICELPKVNVKWSKLNPKTLHYFAENPDQLPCNEFYFYRMLREEYGCWLPKEQRAV